MNDLRQNFIYPAIPPSAFRFGSNQFIDVPLRDDGDWRPYLPPEEHQKKNGVESSACYIEAQQHAIAIIQEAQFNLPDQNYSARFNALLSDGGIYGGDPLFGADSMRKIDGLIPEYMLPFADYIKSWQEFHSFNGGDEIACRDEGKKFLENWKLNYDIVFSRDESLDTKFAKLKQALNFSPCPISLYGKIDEQGNYEEKPDGVQDTHLALAVHVDENNCIWIFDTYSPFLKKLPANYNSDFCMRWGVSKLEVVKKKTSIWQALLNIFFREKLIYREFKKHLINISKNR